MYKIIFYVPEGDLEKVKSALFEAGAGRIGDYSHCAWQVLGDGQFMPLEGSQPHLGSWQQLETVREYKVELVCETRLLDDALTALKKAHPYETPAYQVIRCEDL